ncbi:unannotated protein [freshwater metagenome]|uniref:Unannotated protein n=1 Tax=freshwater metagenome TaxID=449393 RepID=A0A6J7KIW2_9ZZZZ
MVWPIFVGLKAIEGLLELLTSDRGARPSLNFVNQLFVSAGIGEVGDLHESRDNCVFEIVHRISDIIGKVHDLSLDAFLARKRTLANPIENGSVIFVDSELHRVTATELGLAVD